MACSFKHKAITVERQRPRNVPATPLVGSGFDEMHDSLRFRLVRQRLKPSGHWEMHGFSLGAPEGMYCSSNAFNCSVFLSILSPRHGGKRERTSQENAT